MSSRKARRYSFRSLRGTNPTIQPPTIEKESSAETIWTRLRSPSICPNNNVSPVAQAPTLDLNKYRNMINIAATTPQFVYSLLFFVQENIKDNIFQVMEYF